MRRVNPFPCVNVVFDKHGKRRYRLRKTIAGRKIDCYLPGPYGGADFRAAYEAALAGATPTTRSMPFANEGTMTWLCENYLKSSRYQQLAHSTKRTLRQELDWLMDQCGHLPYKSCEVIHVEQLMARKAGPAAANKVKKNMSMLFNFGIKKRLGVTFNPARYADKWKENPRGFHTWTDEEILQYQNFHKPNSKARLALELILWSGASRQDVVKMGWDNIQDGRLEYCRGKTRIPAFLPIHPDLARELAHIPKDQKWFIAYQNGDEIPQQYTVESFGNWFKDQCRAAGLAHCSAHGLRKSLGTLMANKGFTPDQIRAVLAHKTNKEGAVYTKMADRKSLAEDLKRLNRS